MTVHIAHLIDRGVVRASGADVAKLLDGLITNDIDSLAAIPAIHAALLSPQGKILFAFFVVRSGDEYYLDVTRDQSAALVKRLNFYKLRAAAQFTDVSTEMAVAVSWGGPLPPVPRGVLAYADPRHTDLGYRMILPPGRLAELGRIETDANDYHIHRIALGIPEEVRDYALGDTFPHEADLDLLGGVSFTKGCFVGQEVVSRTQNKAVVRKRVVKISGDNLRSGAEIKHGAGVVGAVGSIAGTVGLAMIRLDRAVEAAAKGEHLTVDDKPIVVDAEALVRYRLSAASKPVIDL
jgi:tRNA-modifying protein YgfZ